jgi:hypothetical protein
MLRFALACALLAAGASGLRVQLRSSARVLSARACAAPLTLRVAPRAAALRMAEDEPAAEQAADPDADAPPKSLLRRLFAKAKGAMDPRALAKMGGSMFLSYGFVSNVNAGLLIVISWATFRRANPLLSPLAFSGMSLPSDTPSTLKPARTLSPA